MCVWINSVSITFRKHITHWAELELKQCAACQLSCPVSVGRHFQQQYANTQSALCSGSLLLTPNGICLMISCTWWLLLLSEFQKRTSGIIILLLASILLSLSFFARANSVTLTHYKSLRLLALHSHKHFEENRLIYRIMFVLLCLFGGHRWIARCASVGSLRVHIVHCWGMKLFPFILKPLLLPR